MVERNLAKVEVESSRLFSRSNFLMPLFPCVQHGGMLPFA